MKNLINWIIALLVIITVSHSQSNTPRAEEKENPLLREQSFIGQRAFPYPNIPSGARVNAIEQSERMKYNKTSKSYILSQQPQWKCIGPFNVGGRIKTVAHHPTKYGTVYAGAAAGGIWKTTDAGDSWEPLFDYQNGIAFGALAIDPSNPDIIYAGTGEASGNVDAYLGAGVFKSTDAGATWKVVGLTDVGAFSKIYVHPKNPNLIYAGAIKSGQGFYKSIDAGANWERTFNATVSDVSINPDNQDDVIIGVNGGGVYYSSDGGETFNLRNECLDAGIGRVSVQMAPSNPDIVYALMEISSIGTIYKSNDKGLNWYVSKSSDAAIFRAPPINQGWYDNYILVHPTNPNFVIAGGIELWRTTNGGIDWGITNYMAGGNQVHVDQHHAAFDPNIPNIIYIGNDGGMYKTTDEGDSWAEINNNLAVTQFYGMAIDYSKANKNYGGTQDNGTVGNWVTSDNWNGLAGGDGFRVMVDPENPNIVYGEQPEGQIWKADIGKKIVYYGMTKGIPADDKGYWDAPIAMDPQNTFALYHGRHAIYASYDYAENWSPLIPKRTGQFTAIVVSPINENVIYAGNNVGELLVSDDAGATWELVSGNGLPMRYVTDIALSRKNDKTGFVTFSGYGSPHVFKTIDIGKSWINISEGLPNVPFNSIAIHPDNEDVIFAASDVGVFGTYNGGVSWFPFGRGLPRSPVVDIAFHLNRIVLPNIVLRIATHGRSMWEIDIPSEAITEPEIVNPSGGEIFTSSTEQKIIWYGFEPPVKVEVTYNDGGSWNTIADNVQSTSLPFVIPNLPTIYARVRITSLSNSSQSKITNTFTIKLLQKGSILKYSSVPYVPYGIAWDGANGLWTTSFYTNRISKLDVDKFTVIKDFPLPGDSLFTDLTLDREKGLIYVHRMNTTDGGGGKIFVVDTNGIIKNQFDSPAPRYPIGLELVDGKLVVGDRDGSKMLYVIDPLTGSTDNIFSNPCQITYGPRGLCYDGTKYLYQACTHFPNGGSLTESYLQKIDKADLTAEVERLPLNDINGYINCRGVEYDPRDKNLWVSDFGGNIYKIAGFETQVIADVPKEEQKTERQHELNVNIFPNPMNEFSTISFNSQKPEARIKIELVNVLGTIIGTLFDNITFANNPNVLQINGVNYSSGIYYLTFSKDGIVMRTEKLIIIK